MVRGLATVEIVNGVPDEYIAASKKALDKDQGPEFERQVRSMYDRWHVSLSSRYGRGSSTSAPAACRDFSRGLRATLRAHTSRPMPHDRGLD